ncbi:TatD family hydrolase, partial [Bacillus cereus]
AHAEEIIAIGEVGLPYYLTKEDEGVTIDSYVAILRRFIELASEYDLPIVLHAVYEDADIVCDLLEEYKISRAHFHWFKGNEATMGRMVRNGYYISITPDVLHKEKIRKIVSY